MEKKKFVLALLPILFLAFPSCQKSGLLSSYGIFQMENDTTVVVNGTIGSRTPTHWDNLVADNPDIRLMILEECPGSSDDDANLKMAKGIHQLKLNMHLRSYSEIASGATDLFLAGNKRTKEPGARIGVHSWTDGRTEGRDLPEGHQEHQPYIDYFTAIGMSNQEAKEFYFFTLRAASADDMHWMSQAEVNKYGLITH